MFLTQYDKKEYTPSVAGSGVKITYAGEFDKKGKFHLVEKGKYDVYQEIQSYADSVDIHILLAKYTNGDVNALNQVASSYGDISNMPDNFIDAMNLVIDARDKFDRLPIEVKQKFDNSFEVYMASVGSPEWFNNLGFAEKPDTAGVAVDASQVGKTTVKADNSADVPVQENVQVDKAE